MLFQEEFNSDLEVAKPKIDTTKRDLMAEEMAGSSLTSDISMGKYQLKKTADGFVEKPEIRRVVKSFILDGVAVAKKAENIKSGIYELNGVQYKIKWRMKPFTDVSANNGEPHLETKDLVNIILRIENIDTGERTTIRTIGEEAFHMTKLKVKKNIIIPIAEMIYKGRYEVKPDYKGGYEVSPNAVDKDAVKILAELNRLLTMMATQKDDEENVVENPSTVEPS